MLLTEEYVLKLTF